MKSYLTITVMIGLSSVATQSHAQIVQIGPLGGVRVRVPFVNVDVGPFGGTHVRAPFVDIATPGFGAFAPGAVIMRRSYAPDYQLSPSFVAPPANSLSTLPYEGPPLDEHWVEPMRTGESLEAFQLRVLEKLAASWTQLYADLEGIKNGDSLQTYLNIPQAALRDFRRLSGVQLDRIIVNYEAMNRTSEFAYVVRLPSFQETRSQLHFIRQLATQGQDDDAAKAEELLRDRRAF